MKFFSLGPVEMFPHTLEISKKQIPYFRTKEFSDMMFETEALLKKCLYANPSDKIVFLTASGTAAMEAAVFNCFSPKDKLLIINGGIFGQRFVDICKAYKIPYDSVDLKFGEILSKNKLQEYANRKYTALLVNIHETSTGLLYDIELLSRFCKENKMFLCVDAISSFLADEYNISKYDIDVTILSSQKGLAIGPGMSFVILSNRIIKEKVENNKVTSLYFNFQDYLKNLERGQTPYTPAVRVVYELNDMLNHIVYTENGVENRISNLQKHVKKFRNELKNIGIEIPTYPLSYASTPKASSGTDVVDSVISPSLLLPSLTNFAYIFVASTFTCPLYFCHVALSSTL